MSKSFLNMLGADDLDFQINYSKSGKTFDGKDSVVVEVKAILNGDAIEDESVILDLCQLAVIYHRINWGVDDTYVKPYVCSCGENSCIDVFSGLSQKINLLRVVWTVPEDEYSFLEKRRFSFPKKILMKKINELFHQIEGVVEKDKDSVYDVRASYTLNNAIRIWKGLEPEFENPNAPLSDDVKLDVDFDEAISIKDIINQTIKPAESK